MNYRVRLVGLLLLSALGGGNPRERQACAMARPLALLYFVPTFLLSLYCALFFACLLLLRLRLPSFSSVSLCHFILALPMLR